MRQETSIYPPWPSEEPETSRFPAAAGYNEQTDLPSPTLIEPVGMSSRSLLQLQVGGACPPKTVLLPDRLAKHVDMLLLNP